MSNLTLHLKSPFFYAITGGVKPFEFRDRTEYWRKRLEGRNYDTVTFCAGYPKKDDLIRRHTVKYTGYELQTIIHPHFGDKPKDVYAIRTKG